MEFASIGYTHFVRWSLHDLAIAGETNDDAIRARWIQSFGSLSASGSLPDLSLQLDLTSAVPPPPPGPAHFRQNDLIEYRLTGDQLSAYFPRYGLIHLHLEQGRSEGQVVRAALDTYGVFEDLVAISLSPHLRRRGLFLIHAFAAAPRPLPGLQPSQGERGILIVGQIGSGKTTTGMALLDAGWKLLSNDSPIISAEGEILSYPGLIAATPYSLDHFASTRPLIPTPLIAYANRKVSFAAESVWPNVWIARARPAAILFPQIEPRADHLLEPLSQPEALRMLLPHAIEQWDREMIPAHLALLKRLVETTPAFRLRLGPDVSALAEGVAEGVR